MKGLQEIVLAGALSLMGCDVNKDIPVKEGMIDNLRLVMIYECRTGEEDRLKIEIYDSNNALRFRGKLFSFDEVQFNDVKSLKRVGEYMKGAYDCFPNK